MNSRLVVSIYVVEVWLVSNGRIKKVIITCKYYYLDEYECFVESSQDYDDEIIC